MDVPAADADDSQTDATPADAAGTMLAQDAYIKPSNTNSRDEFSPSIALSLDGSTLAVGAPYEASAATGINGDQTDNTAASGAVYVYERDNGTWAQQAYIKASNTNAADRFGWRVALAADGSTLVVGAPYESSAATGIGGNQADNSATAAGAAYIFVRNGTTWSQQAYVKASNTNQGDGFGAGVTISSDGSLVAVGANNEASAAVGVNGNQSDNTMSNAGAAYVFVHSGQGWAQEAYLKASNTNGGDEFGESLVLSADGTTLAVAARLERSAATGINGDQADNSVSNAGAVYVFTRANGAWSQQAYVKASNTNTNAIFGSSLGLSANGSRLAVGAPHEASAATGINGNQADTSAAFSGAAYVFSRTNRTWAQEAYIKASNTDAGDEFGAVALSADGARLVVGADGESSNSRGIDGNALDNTARGAGAAYVFTRATSWAQVHYVKASNTDAFDGFGYSVAVSGDASTFAVGAPSEASSATGIDGNQADNSMMFAGATYVFR